MLCPIRWIEPHVHCDSRGFFVRTYRQDVLPAMGFEDNFCEENHSRSLHGVLRGLHYQLRKPQGKACYVARGEVYDVVVDLRTNSPIRNARK